MDVLTVERINPTTGKPESVTFRPVVRKSGLMDTAASALALTGGADGDVIVIADAFGRRTHAVVLASKRRIEPLDVVVICDFVEADE